MKNRKNILRIYIIIVVLIIATFSFFVMRTQAQDDIITDLSANLEALNVPLDAILIRSRNPFIVEIRLNMINEAGDSLTEDVWFIDLTNHEASTYRKSGIYLDGYYIALVSDSGKVFEYSYTGIHPDSPARVPFISDIAKLDGKQSEELLMDELDFGGMSVDELDVSLGAGSRLDVQTLTIRILYLKLLQQ